ncbi:hypothetical protein GC102_10525 [Paenibacillus sp. LMG 31460]|uniref:Uncharacterized protein n=1 Tax=Paenibacillus germinis TaxID=2654979 RepID=A0ABX1YYJ2_9BACL|nr:hypothetical protein [Paenibacillus germinis]NOU86207.1 hypothetical protein [Paenibacillus germinis]
MRSGNKLYVSDSDLDFNFRIVEVIENENITVSVLDIMEVGAITFKVEGQQSNIGNYLYGESVDEYIPTITFDQAKQMAENASREDLERYIIDPQTPFLEDFVLEGECCWFFFYNPDIEIPEQDWSRRMLSAYAVSKKGDMRHTYNYSSDPIKLQDYLQAMSAHFKKKCT